jgi:CRP-like cAMP-binding protein
MLEATKLREVAAWVDMLSDREVERACQGITERTFAAGQAICHRGDRLDAWTGVATGLVKISAISREGKAMTFAGIGPGGWFGEGSVLKKEPRRYDLVAVRETRLLFMNQATFDWLFEHSAGFNKYLVRLLNERMAQFIATVEYDRILEPTARVARHLAWLCHPVLYPRAGSEIAIAQEELALLAGISRQAVNRSLQTLEASGLIRIERGTVVLVDRDKLQRYGD